MEVQVSWETANHYLPMRQLNFVDLFPWKILNFVLSYWSLNLYVSNQLMFDSMMTMELSGMWILMRMNYGEKKELVSNKGMLVVEVQIVG